MRFLVLLARHCQSPANAGVSGTGNPIGLTERGVEQARRLGTFVEDMSEGYDVVAAMTSPALRARSTARIALERGGQGDRVQVVQDQDLREQEHVESDADVRARAHSILARIRDAVVDVTAEVVGGEVDAPEGAHQVLLIVSHADFIRCAIMEMAEMEVQMPDGMNPADLDICDNGAVRYGFRFSFTIFLFFVLLFFLFFVVLFCFTIFFIYCFTIFFAFLCFTIFFCFYMFYYFFAFLCFTIFFTIFFLSFSIIFFQFLSIYFLLSFTSPFYFFFFPLFSAM